MRELISLHIGQAGVQIAEKCVDLLCQEHRIDFSGKSYGEEFDQYFSDPFFENIQEKYVPRSVLVDTESNVLDQVRTGNHANLYHPDRLISLNEDASNVFARAYNVLSVPLNELVLEQLRRTIEECDAPQGLQVFHSLGGGTGSGYTASLLTLLKDNIGKMATIDMCVFPTSERSSAVVEPYNGILGLSMISQKCNIVTLFDNHSLNNIWCNNLMLPNPNFDELNQLIAMIQSSMTASVRFPGQLNVDLIEFPTNLVPFELSNFVTASYAPLYSSKVEKHQKNYCVHRLTNSVISNKNRLFNSMEIDQVIVSCCLLYRGALANSSISSAVNDLKVNKKMKFASWAPTGFKIGINSSEVPCFDERISNADIAVCMIANSSAVVEPFKKILNNFRIMFEKGAFVHWYEKEGMERSEFYECYNRVYEIVDSYNSI